MVHEIQMDELPDRKRRFCFYFWISNKQVIIPKALIPTVPPMDAKLPSRRIAYFIFFMFSYVIYTYYTSNLLSGLVNDHDRVLTLEMLADSPLEFVIVNYMQLSSVGSVSIKYISLIIWL